MQHGARFQFVYDQTNGKWIPWEGTPPGFGGVTLYTFAGQLIDTPQGQGDAQATNWLLGTGAFNYVYSDNDGAWNRARDISAADTVNNPTTGTPISLDFGMVFNGTEWDRIRSVPTDSDNIATSVIGFQGVANFIYGFDGTTFDRIRSFAADADNVAAPTLGLLGGAHFSFLFDGTNFDRARSLVDNADDAAADIVGLTGVVARLQAFDGTTYDRLRTGSIANLTASQTPAPLLTTTPGDWSITHAPAANTQATITRAAGSSGVRHVCTSISATLSAQATATSGDVQVNLRDGASGAGTILWSQTVRVGGAGGAIADRAILQLSGLRIFGSDATAMTLEFSAAGGANTFESVALTGHDIV